MRHAGLSAVVDGFGRGVVAVVENLAADVGGGGWHLIGGPGDKGCAGLCDGNGDRLHDIQTGVINRSGRAGAGENKVIRGNIDIIRAGHDGHEDIAIGIDLGQRAVEAADVDVSLRVGTDGAVIDAGGRDGVDYVHRHRIKTGNGARGAGTIA